MSKINIQGIVDDIKSQISVYTPLLEAVVNSIQAIEEGKIQKGKIRLIFERDGQQQFVDDALPEIKSVTVIDNGIGFIESNKEAFDTFRSHAKKDIGGKGFGRFMFLKFFNSVNVESIYKANGKGYFIRKFDFGKQYDIVVNETNEAYIEKINENLTQIFLKNLKEHHGYDKQLDTIARKLLEHLLIYFVDTEYVCPEIWLEEQDGSGKILLNDFIIKKKEIQLIKSDKFSIKKDDETFDFPVKIFKIYFSAKKSRISLCAQNREVTDTPVHNYIPEFIEDFFEETTVGKNTTRKNYIIKAYVLGKYLTDNVSFERDAFNFDKESPNMFYKVSQKEIETKAADLLRKLYKDEVKVRSEKKKEQILKHVNEEAPWHKPYINDVDLSNFSFNAEPEKIEMELQKYKFEQEQKTKTEVREILADETLEYEKKLGEVLTRINQIGKSDLVHYVSNRKVILEILQKLLNRKPDGSAEYEKDIHKIIFPMGKDSTNTDYHDHNLWVLDERLVFSHYVASDRKINKKTAKREPDLVVFDHKRAFRAGDNEYSNPITLFEFKRPKREIYKAIDDPVAQLGDYLEKIREGKYETPGGVEKIKANDSTPAYCYIIADLTGKIKEFAKKNQLTLSGDGEAFFGFHTGYRMYVEIISYKKLMADANLRNKIFFKKLQLE